MTCRNERFGARRKVEIQGCRATRSHRSTSSKLPPPLDRRGQRAARLWPLLNGGEAGQVGHRSHRAALPTPHFIKSSPLSISCPHLAHAAAIYQPSQLPQAGLSRAARCLTPLSLLKGLPASPCSPTAHEASALPPSLFFYRCRPLQSAPALSNPRPQFACPPQPTHNHNHKPRPLSPPPPPFLLPAANTTLFHGVRIICSPGQSRAIRPNLPPAYQQQPGPSPAQPGAARDGSSQQAP